MRIWIGKRESDIKSYDYFDYSITFWGSNEGINSSFCTESRIHSSYSEDFILFVINKLNSYVKSSSTDCEIYFYNNSLAYKIIAISPFFKTYIKNINDLSVHNLLRHKTLSRLWLSNFVDVPQFASVSKHECNLSNLKRMFPSFDSFVIQKNFSGGGEGTYHLTNTNVSIINSHLKNYEIYLVSPYYDSIPTSCTLLIDKEKVCIFPVSKQLIYGSDQIKYCGNSYYPNASNISKKVKACAQIAGDALQHINYRGICGLDFIVCKDNVFLIEINPRFQGSSLALNETLAQQSLPSLFELNTLCFIDVISSELWNQIQNLEVEFENHFIYYHINNKKMNTVFKIFKDGYDKAKFFEEGVYMYRYLSLPQSIS